MPPGALGGVSVFQLAFWIIFVVLKYLYPTTSHLLELNFSLFHSSSLSQAQKNTLVTWVVHDIRHRQQAQVFPNQDLSKMNGAKTQGTKALALGTYCFWQWHIAFTRKPFAILFILLRVPHTLTWEASADSCRDTPQGTLCTFTLLGGQRRFKNLLLQVTLTFFLYTC